MSLLWEAKFPIKTRCDISSILRRNSVKHRGLKGPGSFHWLKLILNLHTIDKIKYGIYKNESFCGRARTYSMNLDKTPWQPLNCDIELTWSCFCTVPHFTNTACEAFILSLYLCELDQITSRWWEKKNPITSRLNCAFYSLSAALKHRVRRSFALLSNITPWIIGRDLRSLHQADMYNWKRDWKMIWDVSACTLSGEFDLWGSAVMEKKWDWDQSNKQRKERDILRQ